MDKNKFVPSWKNRSFLLSSFLVFVAAVALLITYSHKMSETALEFTRGYMEELAEHDKLNVLDKINGYKENLLEVTEMIRLQKTDTIDDALKLLQLKRKSNMLKNIFLIDSDGITYSYNHVIIDHSDEVYVKSVIEQQKEFLAKPDIASRWYNWNNSMRYALPIKPLLLEDKQIVGICGEYSFDTIGTSLQLQSFGDKGVSSLIDSKGNILSQTGLITQKPIENNFFLDLTETCQIMGKNDAQMVISDIVAMEPVNFIYQVDGEKKLCVTVPLSEQQLTLISSVPIETAQLQYSQMLRLTTVTVIGIAAFILFLSVGLYRTYIASARLTLQRNTAEEIAASKSRFLSNMSHEIRTPLNAIIGFSELLSRSQGLSKENKAQIEKIETSSHYLLSLINDILDMSRIESGKMELALAPLELDPLLDNINSIILGQAKLKGIHYYYNNTFPGQCITGDSVRIQQILMNLLGNSLKFTSCGGSITLQVDCLQDQGESVAMAFTVTDTGCGMSEEFLNHIFDPFTQEYNKNTKKQSGTGLGLAICNEIAQLMGGSIHVESILNQGSTFLVNLPFKKADQPLPSRSPSPLPEQMDWAGVTILVAEDNELNMEILAAILEELQIKTLKAVNGQEACDIFAASQPGEISLILMDMQMPIMDGLEATDQIRASSRPDAKTIPILAVTANAFTSDVETVLAHGMNDHIAKPIDSNLLFSKLYYYIYEREGL